MSEFAPLREAVDSLASRSPSPDFCELERRATRRGRRRVAVAAACAVAFVAVGGAISAGKLVGDNQPSPIGEPTTPTSESPTLQESAEPPATLGALGSELDAILKQAPDWTIADGFPPGYDYAFNGRCSGGLDDWGKGSTSGGDGGIADAGIGGLGFPSEARASDAAAKFVDNLKSCSVTAWRIEQVARTHAVLAFSPTGVAWIQQTGDHVDVLQVPTIDGPPPVEVQVEVAEWMVAYRAWQEAN